MCVEFYLILKVAGAKKSLLTKMIVLSVIMLVTGYLGETVYVDQAAMWGFFSAVAYFAIVYEIWLGGAAKLAKEAGGDVLACSQNPLLVRVSRLGIIYPVRLHGRNSRMDYGDAGFFFGDLGLDMQVLYNIADAINKIGFGLVIYSLACKKTA